MACSNCNNTQNCGCSNGTYTVSATCPPACTEVFNAQCIVYTGVDLTCDGDTVISRNDYLDSVITKLVDYVCSKVAPPASVVAGSAFIDVVPTTDPVTAVTTYTVSADMAAFEIWVGPIITNQILAKVLAGPGIDVAADAVAGTVTVSHEDTSTVVSPLAVTGTGNTFLQAVSFSFDTFGHVTGAAFTTGTVTHQNNFVTAKINPDVGFTWGPDNNPTDLQTAEAPGDTLNFAAGEGIVLNGSTVPSTDAIRVSFAGLAIDAATGLDGDGTIAAPLKNTKNVWTRFTDDSAVSVSADTTTDNLNVIGAGGITTTIDPATDTLEITNTSPATDVTLTSAGGTETLVNDGVGPALVTKGLTGGDGISVSGNATTVTITADVQRELLTGVGYTSADPALSITHTVGETYVQVRAFDGLNDVTNVGAGAIIAMVNSTTFTIEHATRNITDILVIG